MIHATAYDGYVEVKIVGEDWIEFEQDLRRLKDIIDQKDRRYLSHKKIWKITNVEEYTRVPFIQNALLSRKQQLSLF
jgi:hypothetical protein